MGLIGFLVIAASADARAPKGIPTIARANVNGSGVDRSFIRLGGPTCGVAVDGSHIYWTDSNHDAIGRANLDGSAADPTFISGVLPYNCGLAVDGAHIYWSNRATEQSGQSPLISRANLDGSGVEPSFISAPPDSIGLAVGSSFIYWGQEGAGLVRASLSGSSPTVIGSTAGGSMAVDSSHVYWEQIPNTLNGAPFSGIAVGRASLDGSAPNNSLITVPGAEGNVIPGTGGLALDSSHVYWDDPLTQAIGRANLDGSGVNPAFISGLGGFSVVVGGPPVGPFGLAVDASHIYWADSVHGCLVPNLKGKRLKRAKKILKKGNCRLGTVKPKDQKTGKVVKQRPKVGTVLPLGGKVNIKLGRKH